MCGEIYCKDCKHKCKEDVNDREVENFGKNLKMCLLMKMIALMLIGKDGIRGLIEKKFGIGLMNIIVKVSVG